jgi:hypothetical protein
MLTSHMHMLSMLSHIVPRGSHNPEAWDAVHRTWAMEGGGGGGRPHGRGDGMPERFSHPSMRPVVDQMKDVEHSVEYPLSTMRYNEISH